MQHLYIYTHVANEIIQCFLRKLSNISCINLKIKTCLHNTQLNIRDTGQF